MFRTAEAPRPGGPEMGEAGGPPNSEQPSLMQTIGTAIRQPGAIENAANVAAGITTTAVEAWDTARQPGMVATANGVAKLVEGAALEVAPYAGEAPEESVRGWMYNRFDRLRGAATTENLQRAVTCAALIKAGVEYAGDFKRTA